MSRIGKRILTIPSEVTITIVNNIITVKGPKETLTYKLPNGINVKLEKDTISTEKTSEEKTIKQLHGTVNALINNMIEGVTKGFKKELEIVGVGYRFSMQGNSLIINAGYSHPVKIDIPSDLKVELISNTEIAIHGCDKVKVGELASTIRKVKKPEPYKGKGIRYKGEHVRQKEGKKAA